MSVAILPVPSFGDATERGEIVEKSGYHQPGRGRVYCGCDLTTRKGAYRDVTVRVDGVTVHYYHQSPVVVTDGETWRIDNHGYKTATTKERICRYLPAGYSVIQRDFEWFVTTPDGERLPFKNGMTIPP